jgi:hypothetical protein
MAYRNGTYVAFHADGNNVPGGKSDIDYYNLMCAWNEHKHHDFTMLERRLALIRTGFRLKLRRLSMLTRFPSSSLTQC